MSTHAEPVLNRRAFLGMAAGGAAVLAVPGVARAARPSGPTPADWVALARDLSGQLVRPSEASYTIARRLSDPRFDSISPAGIAYCKSPHDVATCLAFVRKFKIPVSARCGGHSYAGYSTNSGGLVVDVSRMAGVGFSGTTATVGAGTRLVDLYHSLAARGRAIPGGSCPTVGISGLTLGGGGNFGVATSFTFSTHPAPAPVLFFLSWPWSRAAKVISAWQSWAPHAPDALWSNLHLAAVPGHSTPAIQVGGCYLGSIGGAASLLDRLYAKVGSHPSGYFLNRFSYLNAMLLEAGCSSTGTPYSGPSTPPTGTTARPHPASRGSTPGSAPSGTRCAPTPAARRTRTTSTPTSPTGATPTTAPT